MGKQKRLGAVSAAMINKALPLIGEDAGQVDEEVNEIGFAVVFDGEKFVSLAQSDKIGGTD